MNSQSITTRHHTGTTIVAVVLSAFIATGLLSAVAGLFLSAGTPFERVIVPEHACADHAFVSERETCVRSFLAASRVQSVASR